MDLEAMVNRATANRQAHKQHTDAKRNRGMSLSREELLRIRDHGNELVCEQLKRLGFNPQVTYREHGRMIINVLANQNSKTIHVRTLSHHAGIPNPATDTDYVILCVLHRRPQFYILTQEEATRLSNVSENDAGRIEYWIDVEDYKKNVDRWDKLGTGESAHTEMFK